ncbi:hypothetical protein Pmani_030475 [Petrolisthes manimaculis]|uniref:Hypoxia up-regulated protein 1 n=1 Tax=Petrolisthes manimaculis TaxID=1843537 RepID=A0AAE1NX87_9EUCA|nr:hypothetical protein Pmani_030475 [Petrolisthes manimaculis]
MTSTIAALPKPTVVVECELGLYSVIIIIKMWDIKVLVLLVSVLVGASQAVTIMSIDFGSEWMKVAVVAPGVPMEIALNKESKRKTPAAVSYRNDERTFGEDALTNGVRFPATNYYYLLDLLGKKIDNPIVELYKTRFPFYTIEADEERNTIVFRYDEETTYSVEELVGQMLGNARDLAAAHTDQRIKDCVITVPPFFNQAERRAILTAAQLSGLKVLSLMSSNAAVALNHGMFRRKEINSTVQNILFYDLGASSATATIAAYQSVKTKDRGYSETNPQVTILGMGYDRTLGGLEMQLRLRDFLAAKYTAVKKTSSDVYQSPRAMAKLFKEAGRLKKVLSANTEHNSQVEGVLDEEDFRVMVKREDFEAVCEDVFQRLRAPIDSALISAGMDITTIDQFIIVGGATRVPRVQSLLQEIWGHELGKNINADEAAAMGAVYRAADLGQGFKVKKFHVKESVVFPIEVDFEREVDTPEGTKVTKTVKRSLFPTGNTYPQKKVMTFNKHNSDFVFSVNYGNNEHLSKQETRAASVQNVSVVLVKGVTAAFKKHKEEGNEAKGIKAHFSMDDSGVLNLVDMEAVFEKTVVVDEATTASSTTGSEDEDKAGETKENQTETEPNQSDNKKEEKDGKEEDKDNNKGTVMKEKQVVVKETLNYTVTYLDIPDLTPDSLLISKKKLEDINTAETNRRERESARNTLESYIMDAQDRLYQKEYEAATTEQERDNIRQLCTQLDEWLYEEGFEEATSVYRVKISELMSLFEPVKDRVQQHRDRPEALQALTDMLNASSMFVVRAREAPQEQQFFTDVEVTAIDKLIVDTQKWLEEKFELQSKTPLYEDPKLTLTDIGEKWSALDREIKYLINKAKIVKAKKDREAAEAKIKEEKEEKEKKEKNKKKTNQTEKQEKQDEEVIKEDVEKKGDGEKDETVSSNTDDPLNIFQETDQENDAEADRRKETEEEEEEEKEEEVEEIGDEDSSEHTEL